MRIGVPREIKPEELRVGLTPASVADLVSHGNRVIVESEAGAGSGFADEEYRRAGGEIGDVDEAFSADLVVKVKEPQPTEFARLHEGQTLFTFLHLAAEKALTEALVASGCAAIAYETVTAPDGSLPLLTPMSEVAGRMATQVGAYALQSGSGGRGVLLGGVPGVVPGRVVILGGGVAGYNAAMMAVGLGADVTIFDRSVPRLRILADRFAGRAKTATSDPDTVAESVAQADLVIGSVLIPGATAPRLLTREHVRGMKPGSALVDISIDQGGCCETSRPTTHASPTFVDEGVVHYCVTNMPGAVARTSTMALNSVTLPFVKEIAHEGAQEAVARDPLLAGGLNVDAGRICHPAVAEAMGVSTAELPSTV